MTSRSAPGPQRSKNVPTTGETFQGASFNSRASRRFCLHRAAFIASDFAGTISRTVSGGLTVRGRAAVYFSGGVCLQTRACLLEGSPEWSRLERLEYLLGGHHNPDIYTGAVRAELDGLSQENEKTETASVRRTRSPSCYSANSSQHFSRICLSFPL